MSENETEEAVAVDPIVGDDGGWPDIPLERCEIQFLMNVADVDSLADALDVAAISLARYGMDSFFILATDPDSGTQWVIHDGQVYQGEDGEKLLERIAKARQELEGDDEGAEQE